MAGVLSPRTVLLVFVFVVLSVYDVFARSDRAAHALSSGGTIIVRRIACGRYRQFQFDAVAAGNSDHKDDCSGHKRCGDTGLLGT